MKKLLVIFFLIFFTFGTAKAEQNTFDILVLPTDLLNICENYYCFPEVSNIIASDVIKDLNEYNNIKAKSLSEIRSKINSSQELRNKIISLLSNYETNDRIDFESLKSISKTLSVNSALIISSYANNDQTTLRRSLWEILEISNAFKISYPFNLATSVVLIDIPNETIIWSAKYNKNVSDSNGYFMAKNLAQANSQLEKINFYSKDNVSKNISENINLRFFPKESTTIDIPTNITPTYSPNALEKLVKPKILEELNNKNNYDNVNDFIFQF